MNARGSRRELLRIAPRQNDFGAMFRETLRHAETDAAAPAGDESDFVPEKGLAEDTRHPKQLSTEKCEAPPGGAAAGRKLRPTTLPGYSLFGRREITNDLVLPYL